MEKLQSYHKVSVLLHWVIALFILGQLFLGFWMLSVPKEPTGFRAQWFNLHKSLGVIILLLMLIRLCWRIYKKPPTLGSSVNKIMRHLAIYMHRFLYTVLIALPFTGLIGSTFTEYPLKIWGVIVPRFWMPDPQLKQLFSATHLLLVYLFLVIVIGHIAMGFWHAYRRDGIMQRMMFSSNNRENYL